MDHDDAFIHRAMVPIWKGSRVWKWCEETIGAHGIDWDFVLPYFYFKNEEDLIMFKLTWAP